MKVRVDLAAFRKRRGCAPGGDGQWVFDLGPGLVIVHNGLFNEGKARAVAFANHLGIGTVSLRDGSGRFP